jgi:nucleoside-diphosphate-sugar epimerase
MEAEVDLTRIVLASMSAMHCSKLIFFSSCKVYGNNDTSLVSYDETHPANPVCMYGRAKLECESLIADQANSNLSSIIFRLPPVLNESNGSNLAKLMMFARKKNPILSFAEGETNQRSFISFNNIELVMKYILDNPSFIQDSQVFNLADDSSISLHDLLRALSGKDIYIAPKIISRLVFRAPFLKHFLLKLYGNFVIDNSKLQNEMDVKLASTHQLLVNGETI